MPQFKILPSSIDAEKSVLGAMLFRNGEAIGEVQGYLTAEEFYEEPHRLLYNAMLDVYEQNSSLDLVLLIDYLQRKGIINQVGGNQSVLALGLMVPTNALILKHAQIIKEKYKLRRLIAIGEEITDEAYADRIDVDNIVDKAEQKLFALASHENDMNFEHIQPIILRVHEKINRIYEKGSGFTGLGTGYQTFDRMTGGLQKSDFIILAARPSMGKTALALNIANNIARVKTSEDGRTAVRASNGTVAIFSLEMSKEQLGFRLLCLESQINSQNLSTGFLSDEEWQSVQEAADRTARASLYIDDTPGLTMIELRSRARRLKKEIGIDLLLIDYLQLMQGSNTTRESNRQQEVSEISRSMKALARELDIPVIALSQLSRAVEMRAEKRPQLSDLRESGSLEQDADIVMFLYRESYYKEVAQEDDITELIISKHRNGPTGVVNLRFKGEAMMFTEETKMQ